MSRYEVDQADQIDMVGTRPPRAMVQRAKEFGPLDPVGGEPVPETSTVMLFGGVDYADQLVYALRLAMFHQDDDAPVRLWSETDYIKQIARLERRGKWANSSGTAEMIDEYEVNRMNFEEYAESRILVLTDLCASNGRYQRGEVELITDLLYDRTTGSGEDVTIVVAAAQSLPDYETYVKFRTIVCPLYEQFHL